MSVREGKEDPRLTRKRESRRPEEETLNAPQGGVGSRPVRDQTGRCNDFYKHVSHDYTDPAKVIHYRAEGTSEFTGPVYIPQHAPYGILYRGLQDRARCSM